MEFFMNLFRGRGSDNQTISNYIKESADVEKGLEDLAKAALENEQPARALMYRSQAAILEKMRTQVEQGRGAHEKLTLSPEEQQKLEKSIELDLKYLKGEEYAKEAFQDYHNHDKEFLQEIKGEVDMEVKDLMTSANLAFNTELSEIASFGTESIVQHMSQVPETPAEKAGIAPQKSIDNEKDKTRERSRDRGRDNEYDDPSMNGPSLTP